MCTTQHKVAKALSFHSQATQVLYALPFCMFEPFLILLRVTLSSLATSHLAIAIVEKFDMHSTQYAKGRQRHTASLPLGVAATSRQQRQPGLKISSSGSPAQATVTMSPRIRRPKEGEGSRACPPARSQNNMNYNGEWRWSVIRVSRQGPHPTPPDSPAPPPSLQVLTTTWQFRASVLDLT